MEASFRLLCRPAKTTDYRAEHFLSLPISACAVTTASARAPSCWTPGVAASIAGVLPLVSCGNYREHVDIDAEQQVAAAVVPA